MSSPCFMCGVRTDVACRHRPAEAIPQPAAPLQEFDLLGQIAKRSSRVGGGNFRQFTASSKAKPKPE